ncbi:UNVERIFIED_CONTAM: hypothetical protein PYX00_010979 [Menopon gallinae]|uniref:Excinuclease ABC subunit A n=1 Tax=Menopon gallinae TaxID=328185 RepID=A0AAW2H727_9NEOP
MSGKIVRLSFDFETLEAIDILKSLTLEKLLSLQSFGLYSSVQFVTPLEQIKRAIISIGEEMEEVYEDFNAQGKIVEAQRIRTRTLYDMEMLQETQRCAGVENYTKHLTGREIGSMPYTLFSYFPKDFLLIVDESHVTLPQVRGMYNGDRAQFESCINQVIYVSATPGAEELSKTKNQVVEQIIRPTGLLDPVVEVRSTQGQMHDLYVGSKVTLMAPVLQSKKGEGKKYFDLARSLGFQKVRVDGQIFDIEDIKDDKRLEKNIKHSIDIVVDRIRLSDKVHKRLAESLEICLKQAEGYVRVLFQGGDESELENEVLLSEHHSCVKCGFTFSELEPRLFSFNNPYGACGECDGLGWSLEPALSKILVDENLSYYQGGLAFYSPLGMATRGPAIIKSLAQALNFDLDLPFKNWDKKKLDQLIYGAGDKSFTVVYQSREGSSCFKSSRRWGGLLEELRTRYKEADTPSAREYYERFMEIKQCSLCEDLGNTLIVVEHDERTLRSAGYIVEIGPGSGVNGGEVTFQGTYEEMLNSKDSLTGSFLNGAQEICVPNERRHGNGKYLKIKGAHLNNLKGIDVELPLGGEAQRIKLAYELSKRSTGKTLYIIDEPTTGLHWADIKLLLEVLHELVNRGNSVVLIEHNMDVIKQADWIVDLGPEGGEGGGQILATGSPEEVSQCEASYTGKFLREYLKS